MIWYTGERVVEKEMKIRAGNTKQEKGIGTGIKKTRVCPSPGHKPTMYPVLMDFNSSLMRRPIRKAIAQLSLPRTVLVNACCASVNRILHCLGLDNTLCGPSISESLSKPSVLDLWKHVSGHLLCPDSGLILLSHLFPQPELPWMRAEIQRSALVMQWVATVGRKVLCLIAWVPTLALPLIDLFHWARHSMSSCSSFLLHIVETILVPSSWDSGGS